MCMEHFYKMTTIRALIPCSWIMWIHNHAPSFEWLCKLILRKNGGSHSAADCLITSGECPPCFCLWWFQDDSFLTFSTYLQKGSLLVYCSCISTLLWHFSTCMLECAEIRSWRWALILVGDFFWWLPFVCPLVLVPPLHFVTMSISACKALSLISWVKESQSNSPKHPFSLPNSWFPSYLIAFLFHHISRYPVECSFAQLWSTNLMFYSSWI